jgi:hypothetical protein
MEMQAISAAAVSNEAILRWIGIFTAALDASTRGRLLNAVVDQPLTPKAGFIGFRDPPAERDALTRQQYKRQEGELLASTSSVCCGISRSPEFRESSRIAKRSLTSGCFRGTEVTRAVFRKKSSIGSNEARIPTR